MHFQTVNSDYGLKITKINSSHKVKTRSAVQSVWQSPQRCGFVSTGREECEVDRMPSSLYYLIRVFRDNNAGQRLSQISLQVSQHNFVIVSARQKIISLIWEANRSYVCGVRSESLYYSSAANIVKHTIRIFMTRNEKSSRRVDANWGHSAA